MRGETLTITETVTFHTEECCNCGVLFAMTEAFYKQRLKNKEQDEFYCPNGHRQWYIGKSDATKAKEAQRAREQAEARLQAEIDQRKATERELKRIQQRAKGGACPCCNRTFVQLARHIKSQHPDYRP